MRDSKSFASGKTVRWWPADSVPPKQPSQSVWRIGRWFPRREPSLYQRCLAVHIYHASKQTSMH
jgi:hypothetical protein